MITYDGDTLLDFLIYFLENLKFVSWYTIALSCGIWTLFYQTVRCICVGRSSNWCNRTVTLIHGLIISISGLQSCFEDSEWVFSYPEEETTLKQELILITSLGYFLYDLMWCLVHEKETSLILYHHLYSCIALYRILISQVNGATACCGLGITEFTNPLQQWRWFLRVEGYHNTPLFQFVEVMFILVFIVLRIALGTYICVYSICLYPYSWEFKILMTILYALSWFFFIDMVNFAFVKYINKICNRN